MYRYPLNNCVASVKSKVFRETERWKYETEEKHDDLFHTRLLESPMHVAMVSSSSPDAPLRDMKGMKRHLRTQYDVLGKESQWPEYMVCHVSSILRAIGEVYCQANNKHEAMLYFRASWELKRSFTSYKASRQVINNLIRIATLHNDLGEPKMARLAYLELLPMVIDMYGPEHDETAKIFNAISAINWKQFPDWKTEYCYF